MTIRDEFEAPGVGRGRTLILRPADAQALIERARSLDIAVLGVDGFWLTETTTQPDLANSVDLSADPSSSWESALAFVAERSETGLMFEVVLDDLRSSGAWRQD
jgi:hypothetical protein